MHMNRSEIRVQMQIRDPGFLGGLPQCGTEDVDVGVLAVPTQLQPSSEAGMQGQQYLLRCVVDDEGGRGDVTGGASPAATVGSGVQEGQHRVPQRILIGVGRIPVGQQRDR